MRPTARSSAIHNEPTQPPDAAAKILDAALQAFAANGFDGATTREIARSAGVPLGLIQYHFGGKLKLWQAAVERAFDEIRLDLDLEEAAHSSTEPDGIGVLRAGIRAHVRYVGAHPEFARLMYDEGKRRGPRMRWIVDRHTKPMFERITPMISHLQSLGRLPADVAPEHFVYALLGSINTYFHQAEELRRITGKNANSPSEIEAHAQAVEWLFLGPPSAE